MTESSDQRNLGIIFPDMDFASLEDLPDVKVFLRDCGLAEDVIAYKTRQLRASTLLQFTNDRPPKRIVTIAREEQLETADDSSKPPMLGYAHAALTAEGRCRLLDLDVLPSQPNFPLKRGILYLLMHMLSLLGQNRMVIDVPKGTLEEDFFLSQNFHPIVRPAREGMTRHAVGFHNTGIDSFRIIPYEIAMKTPPPSVFFDLRFKSPYHDHDMGDAFDQEYRDLAGNTDGSEASNRNDNVEYDFDGLKEIRKATGMPRLLGLSVHDQQAKLVDVFRHRGYGDQKMKKLKGLVEGALWDQKVNGIKSRKVITFDHNGEDYLAAILAHMGEDGCINIRAIGYDPAHEGSRSIVPCLESLQILAHKRNCNRMYVSDENDPNILHALQDFGFDPLPLRKVASSDEMETAAMGKSLIGGNFQQLVALRGARALGNVVPFPRHSPPTPS